MTTALENTYELDTPVRALARSAARFGDNTLVDFDGTTFSFNDVERRSTRMANALRALGIEARESVTTMLDNNIDAIVGWFAISKLDAVWVPMNTAFKRDFLRHQLVDSESRVVICESAYLGRIVEIAEQLPGVRHILVRDTVGAVPPCPIPILLLDDFRGDDDSPLAPAAQPGDLACLAYTSGTTGASKGCMISHNYICNFARQLHAGLPIRGREDVLWTHSPLFHMNGIAGIVMVGIRFGVRLAIAARFSLSGFWKDIERSNATMANLVGSPIPLICGAPESPEQLRCVGRLVCIWGAPISAQSRSVMENRFGVAYVNPYGYGQSEGCKVTTLDYGEIPGPIGSIGRSNGDFDVRIVDDDDNVLPPGQSGEIVYRPNKPHIMFEGYWRQPEATLVACRGLWMHSGDIGRLDADGNLYFIDRKKDYLRHGGENVSSVELETVFLQHSAVQEVAVHAVRSELAEDDIKATIVLRTGAEVSEEELCRWSTNRLPHFAVPRFIEFRNELPRNPVGRILKFQLRDEGRTPATWDRSRSTWK
jgi:crotonobetaine/carnitine-CoA ligase